MILTVRDDEEKWWNRWKKIIVQEYEFGIFGEKQCDMLLIQMMRLKVLVSSDIVLCATGSMVDTG